MKHLKIAATADGGIVIEGYGVPFGGPIKGRDLHGQFFSKKTDFALDLIPDGQRPLLFQHGLDSSVDTAVIGRWGVKRIDDGGVWVRAQLDARSEYINEIKELVDNDALGFSSGTMGHLVKVAPKTGEILKWALVELSLTPNPANPNAYIVRANKSAKAHVKSLFATKHGDHDQSEHGNWATGGGGSDKGERGKHDPALTNDQWRAMEAVSIDSANIARHATVLGTFAREMSKDMEGDGNDASRRAWDLAAQYADAVGGGSVNLREYVQDNPHGETAAQIAGSIDQEAQSMEQAQQSMEEFWQAAIAAAGGINTPSEVAISYSNQRASVAAARDNASRLIGAKTLRVKRSVKHGDHDQSEHGNWASGGGEGRAAFGDEKEKSKPGFYGSDHWDKPGMPKTVVVSEMSRDKNGRAILPMPEKYADAGAGRGSGRSAWTAVTTADSNGWLDENDDVTKLTSGLDIPYIPAESITSPEAWTFALGFANGTLDLAPSDDNQGNVIQGMSRSSDKEDFITLSDRLTDVNAHSAAATFDSLIATWDEFGPGASKKNLKVKRSLKHGDHDQSEHGNWATGGGSDKEDKGARDTNRVEANRRSSGAWQEKFGKVGEYRATGETIELAKTLVSEASDSRSANERVVAALHMASQWNSKGPVTMPNGQIPLSGRSVEEELARRVEFSPSEPDKQFHLNLLADLRGETPEEIQAEIDMDKFNDWMSGYEVPGYPKTFRAKQT